ncbi:MAG TPA: hypothetical protein VFL27_12410 [Candidatus Dormibacteraeota bacterium]|nr:hypothetical protein [Candidatus Dormibacteraeota bacterium]
MIVTTRPDFPAELPRSVALGVVTGVRIWSVLPIPLGIAMFFVAPSYQTEMLRSPTGWLLLALWIALTASAYAVNEYAIRLSRRGRWPIGALLIAATTMFLTFPALWIVFLGPALVVLLQQPS